MRLMIHGSVFFAAIFLATAQPVVNGNNGGVPHTSLDHAVCAMNGIAIADELMNSIIFIWQGTLNCGHGHNAADCSTEVSYAIQSVTNMVNSVLRTLQNCAGMLNDYKASCGIAAGDVVSSLAGVTATSSGIVKHCGKQSVQPIPGLDQSSDYSENENENGQRTASFPLFHGNDGNFSNNLAHVFGGHCIVDVKSLLKTTIKASIFIAIASKSCEAHPFSLNLKNGDCAPDIVAVIAAIAELGEYIAGVVGQCSKPLNEDSACASEVLGLVRNLAGLSHAGEDMAVKCKPNSAERLYLENRGKGIGVKAQDNSKTSLTLFCLAALLPITAALSFAGGQRMAKGSSLHDTSSFTPLRLYEE